jgi:hypothetical protein
MKHARHSTDKKPTPRSVLINVDVTVSQSSHPITLVTSSSCTRITSFPTSQDVAHIPLLHPRLPLCKSMQFCKSTTVKTVVFSHYMKLNTSRTISCSVKTDNSCFVQIYCILTDKITNTKQNPNQRSLLWHNIMADGRTMFTVPIMSQTNPAHTYIKL